MDSFCTRTSSYRISQTEESDWIADIVWPKSKPGANDWVSVLVSAEGIQVVCNDPTKEMRDPIPLNHPEWLGQTIPFLIKLLAP